MYKNKLNPKTVELFNSYRIVTSRETPEVEMSSLPFNSEGYYELPLELAIRKQSFTTTYCPPLSSDLEGNDFTKFAIKQFVVLKDMNYKVPSSILIEFIWSKFMECFTVSAESNWSYSEVEILELDTFVPSSSGLDLQSSNYVSMYTNLKYWKQVAKVSKSLKCVINPVTVVWKDGFVPSDVGVRLKVIVSHRSVARRKYAEKLWKSGMDREAIAHKMNLSVVTIQRYLPTSDYGHRRPKKRKKSDMAILDILEWRIQNPKGKQTQCAVALGKSIATIKRYWNIKS